LKPMTFSLSKMYSIQLYKSAIILSINFNMFFAFLLNKMQNRRIKSPAVGLFSLINYFLLITTTPARAITARMERPIKPVSPVGVVPLVSLDSPGCAGA
jgi:hypothetical protein